MASVSNIQLHEPQPSAIPNLSSMSWSAMPNFYELVSMSPNHIIGTVNNKHHYFHTDHMAKRLQTIQMERDEARRERDELLSILTQTAPDEIPSHLHPPQQHEEDDEESTRKKRRFSSPAATRHAIL